MHIPLSEKPLSPGLYLVPTPIGNLADITLRALYVLKSVDRIAAEDTRVTRTLLNHYGLSTPMTSYHEHADQNVHAELIHVLKQGRSVALVSDAGTPLISDPGFDLVRSCLHHHIPVIPLPGASSVLTALIGSGLPQHAFTFGGFIPTREQARHKFLEPFKPVQHTLIFFETARRLYETLQVCLQVFGDREVVIARELTKIYETFHRGSLAQLAQNPEMDTLKGEVVLLIAGACAEVVGEEVMIQALKEALQHASLSDAVKQVCQDLEVPRNIVYRQALRLQEEYQKR